MPARRRLSSIVAGVAAGIVLLLLLPRPAGREPRLLPRWAVDVPTAATVGTALADSAEPGLPFQLPGHIGYVSAAGDVLFQESVLYGASVGRDHFINYSRVSANLAVRDPRGGLVAGVVTDGYPVLSPDGAWFVAIVATGLDLFAHRSLDGQPLWRANLSAPITCISMAADHVLLGMADGGLQLFDRDGSRRERLQLSGGAVDVVVGCSSDGGGRGAAVSGLRPQQLFVLDTEPELRITSRFELASDHRREVPLALIPGTQLILTAASTGTLVVDVQRGHSDVIGVSAPRQFVSLHRDASGVPLIGGSLFAAAGEGVTPTLGIGHLAGRQRQLLVSTPALAWWLAAVDGGLLMGIDEALLRVDIQSR